ncbi:hypothetical protein CMEL01_04514 [Colletotrichum melonis]|uniref:CHAT domain-containing protein n=1 Tax=Colletotrichum melonis TaxID=1209925 RepID=A0AAI9XPR6_9PEZI|nr:hypothetical protein CMEL01_04514 [Colletotrichum melonis]
MDPFQYNSTYDLGSGLYRPEQIESTPDPNHATEIVQGFIEIQQRLVDNESEILSISKPHSPSVDLEILIEGVRGILGNRKRHSGNDHRDIIVPKVSELSSDAKEDLLRSANTLKSFYRSWETNSMLRWRQEWPQRRVNMHTDYWWKRQDDTYDILLVVGHVLGCLSLFATSYLIYEEAIRGLEMLRRTTSQGHYRKDHDPNPDFQNVYFLAARMALKWYFSAGSVTVPPPQLKLAFTSLERGTQRGLLDMMHKDAVRKDLNGAFLSEQFRTGYESSKSTENKPFIKETAELVRNKAWRSEGTSFERHTSAVETLHRMLQQVEEAPSMDDNGVRIKCKADLKHHEDQIAKAAVSGTTTTRTDVVRLRDIVNLIPADTAILQYYYEGNINMRTPRGEACTSITGENFIVWKITKQGITAPSLSTVVIADLEDWVRRYRNLCASASDIPPSLELSLTEVLFPSALNLDNTANLIIIPCRSLFQFPFHVLPCLKSDPTQSRTVSYVPSLSSYYALKTRIRSNVERKVLAIGNPSRMSHVDRITGRVTPLPSLPGAEIEAEVIARLQSANLALTGSAATKEAILLNIHQYDILHLATHGDFSEEFSTLSEISVADGECISVEDFTDAGMDHELVVMSACHTGGVSYAGGGNTAGFATSLIASGVRNVLVTLWPINDNITVIFMRRFYESLASGQSLREALKAAQSAIFQALPRAVEIELAEIRDLLGNSEKQDTERVISPLGGKKGHLNYSQPRYWAAFILMGADLNVSESPEEHHSESGSDTEHRHIPVYYRGDPMIIGVQWS